MEKLESLLIRASAGTGKTFQLTNRFLRLMSHGVSPSSIFASTFTRKAAGEITERIFARLARAVLDDGDAKELGGFIGRSHFDTGVAAELFQNLCEGQSRLQISTLDSFFIAIAKVLSDELSLPPAWRIGEEVENEELFVEAVAELLESLSEKELLLLIQLLSKKDATRSVHQRLLRELPPLLSFYFEAPKAAWNWIERIETEDTSLDLETVAALELPTTKQGKPNKNWENARDRIVGAISSHDWKGFFQETLVAAVQEGREKYGPAVIEPQWRIAIENSAKAFVKIALGELHSEQVATHRLLQVFALRLEQGKSATGLYRFDDIKRLLLHSLDAIDRQDMYFRLDSRIDHVLLDEFQDTSTDEWRLLAPMLHELRVDAESGGSFFCVGDIKQSIYGWRGGKSEIFEQLETAFPEFEADVAELNESYRSAPAVLELCNSIFLAEPSGSNEMAMSPAFSRGLARFVSQYRTHSSASNQRANIGYTHFELFSDDATLEEGFVSLLSNLVERPGLQVAVLCRSNSQIEAFASLLGEAGLQEKISIEGRSTLLRSQLIRELLTFIRLLEHPLDGLSEIGFEFSRLKIYLGEDIDDRLVALRQSFFSLGILKFFREILVPAIHDSLSARDLEELEQLMELLVVAESKGIDRCDRLYRYLERVSAGKSSDAPIRLMTIHQSKGLEFDAVVLPALGNAFLPTNRAGQVLTSRDSVFDAPARVLKWPGKALVDQVPEFRRMAEEHDAAYAFEELCLLYVALTRARLATYAFGVSRKKPAKVLKDWRDLLHSTLGAERVTQGDPEWHSKCYSEVETGDSTSTMEPFERVVVRPPKTRRKFFPKRSLSTHGESDELENRESKKLGELAHSVLERIQWQGDEAAAIEQVSLAKKSSTLMVDLEPNLREFFSSTVYQNYFSMQRYAGWEDVRVFRELSLSTVIDEELMSIRIDRLIVGANQIEIVDFKLSRPSDDQMLRRYEEQLLGYKEVCARVFDYPKSSIRAFLLFVEECVQQEV